MTKRVFLEPRDFPITKDLREDIEWLCQSLCLVSGRDLDRTASRILKKIVDAISKHRKVTSKFLAEELSLSEGTINHHIREFIDSGLLIREKKEIKLRASSIRRTIEEIKRDAERMFEDLIEIAEEIDNQLGFKNR